MKKIDALERHVKVYSRPGLPPFHYFAVGEGKRLWHGRNPLTSIDIQTLAESCGITHILDLREPKEWTGPGRFGSEAITEIESRGIVRRNVPIRDTAPPEDDDFASAVAFLQAADELPDSRLYVHCRYGRERTGTILMAWHSLRDGTDCQTALAALNAAGAHLTPLPHQRLQAERWLERHRAGV